MLVLLLLACTSSPTDDSARRAALRDQLFARLGDAYDRPVAELEGADLAQGAEVWRRSCAGCHGDEGRGGGYRAGGMDPAPADLVSPSARFFSPAAELLLVREGSPGTGMPAWNRSLSDEQTRDVYAWLVEQRKKNR